MEDPLDPLHLWKLTNEVIEPLQRNPPEVLYHYTSQEGLTGGSEGDSSVKDALGYGHSSSQ